MSETVSESAVVHEAIERLEEEQVGLGYSPNKANRIDLLKEHERMLNRERQKRYQLRKRNGANGIVTDSNGKPNARLTRLAKNLAEGMNNSAALVEAGFSRHATGMLDLAKTGLAAILKAKALTVETVVECTKERVNATSPMLTTDGCIDRPDWSARTAGCRDAIALLDRAGELPQASQSSGNGNVTLVLQSLNVTLDIVDTQADNEAITSEACKVLNP
jgi:hypothetical protein